MRKRKIHPMFRAEYALWDARRRKLILTVMIARAKHGCRAIKLAALTEMVIAMQVGFWFGPALHTPERVRCQVRELVKMGLLVRVGNGFDYRRRFKRRMMSPFVSNAFDAGILHGIREAENKKRDGGSLTVLNPAPAKSWIAKPTSKAAA